MSCVLGLLVPRKARAGHYPWLPRASLSRPLRTLSRLPLLPRALLISLANTILLPILPLALLLTLQIHSMSFHHLLLMKALYAALMAVLLTPVIVKSALGREG